jgi:CBS domain containing-hemolysin-like protein
MDLVVFLPLITFLIFCSGYYSASETALFSLPLTKIKAYQASASPTHRLIAKLVLEPRNLLVTVFMMNTFVNLLIQNVISHAVGEEASWMLKVAVPFALMLILGEIIPKNIGLQRNVKISNMVAPSINFTQNLLAPIRNLIVTATVPISRILFFYLQEDDTISREELKHVLKTSEEHGVLNQDEAELVWGYLTLQDTTVKALMRHREEIIFFDINESLSTLTSLFVDKECSRIPVCDKTLDNVKGIITAKEFFLHRDQITSSQELEKYLFTPLYIPENTPGRLLMRRFDEYNQVIALVVDEYGSITGLITREDIMEQVIGDITDLRDPVRAYTKSGKYEIIASGRMELSEFNDLFNAHLISENNMVTIGGWLVEQLGDIPKTGTKHELQGFLFQVLSADVKQVSKLFIRKLGTDKGRR